MLKQDVNTCSSFARNEPDNYSFNETSDSHTNKTKNTAVYIKLYANIPVVKRFSVGSSSLYAQLCSIGITY